MSTLFILVLLIATAGFSICKLKKLTVFTFLLTILCYFAIGNGLVASWLLNHLESSNVMPVKVDWGKTNAIILLGAGTVKVLNGDLIKPTSISYSRIDEAARLYNSCKKSGNKCVVIISGGDPLKNGKSEAEVYQSELYDYGVAPLDIILESKSLNTYQNAKFTNEILKSSHYDRIVLVTSGIHIKRAVLDFSHFGINVIPAPSDYISPTMSIIPFGYNFAVTDYALHECVGIWQYRINNYFGWGQ